MGAIDTYLERILNAVYGKDVRQAIHDGIHQCYEDARISDMRTVSDKIDNLMELEKADDTFEDCPVYASASGWALTGDGHCASDAQSKMVKYAVVAGEQIYLKLSADNDGTYQWQDSASVPASGADHVVGEPFIGAENRVVVVPQGATYLIVSQLNSNNTNVVQRALSIAGEKTRKMIPLIYEDYDNLFDGYIKVIESDPNYTTTDFIPCTAGKYYYDIYGGYVADIGYGFTIMYFYDKDKTELRRYNFGKSAGSYSPTAGVGNNNNFRAPKDGYIRLVGNKNKTLPFVDQLCVVEMDTPISTMEEMPPYSENLNVNHKYVKEKLAEIDSSVGSRRNEVAHELDAARHVRTASTDPLTLLHFSDIHGDVEALHRIVADADRLGTSVDEIICTGDMTANVAGAITSWWDRRVLTCIGNHDTASYSDNHYDWTALSMANRDAYYITPFKSGWGITHTTGKSYYYKDYPSAKVRMIVMDDMLYTDNGADATTQTAWLADLLSNAITNNLHVVIAIHAPHGGAVPVECSFTRYDSTTRPVYTDCNTPQAVIDTVASAISNGLKFVGYICGHSHVDVIWDAENDHTQLMYCVTCANVDSVGQWNYADLHRDSENDAYNLVTIDTAHTLVKLIRGGGADIDDHMRTRKAICFNYSTGDIVGESL